MPPVEHFEEFDVGALNHQDPCVLTSVGQGSGLGHPVHVTPLTRDSPRPCRETSENLKKGIQNVGVPLESGLERYSSASLTVGFY